jgi:hypothetical protein
VKITDGPAIMRLGSEIRRWPALTGLLSPNNNDTVHAAFNLSDTETQSWFYFGGRPASAGPPTAPNAPTGPAPTIQIPDSGWMAQYEEGMQRADAEMGERAGQQDVSSGRTPSSSMPAAAILALQEADDTRLGPAIYAMEETIGVAGSRLLHIISQYAFDLLPSDRLWRGRWRFRAVGRGGVLAAGGTAGSARRGLADGAAG